MRSSLGWIVVVAIGIMGCRGGEGLLEAKAHLAKTSKRAYNASLASEQKFARKSERNGRGKNKLDAGVYVDGAYVATLRYHELPAALPTTWFPMQDGSKSQRYTIADYLAAIGVDLAKVRALHLHGGRGRVTVIDGDEVRRTAGGLHITFTRGIGGDPQFRYPDVDLETNTAIDKIGSVAVYVDKEPPVLAHGQLMLDGKVVSGLAYADEAPRGTRVYLDGRYLGSVQRRDLAGEDADGSYALAGYVASLGVDAAKVREVQIVAGDAIARDVAPLGSIQFSVPEQSRGRIRIDGVEKPVEAVLLYSTTRPVDRRAGLEGTNDDGLRFATQPDSQKGNVHSGKIARDGAPERRPLGG